jgi:hypothetical protein
LFIYIYKYKANLKMENTNTKLVNTLKRLYENQEFSTTFEEEVYSWNSDETFTEDWEIRYFLKLNQILGTGSDTIVSFDVIITDIIIDGDGRYDKWEFDDFDENKWYIQKVENDLYNTIGTVFPLSFYFNFLPEE